MTSTEIVTLTKRRSNLATMTRYYGADSPQACEARQAFWTARLIEDIRAALAVADLTPAQRREIADTVLGS